MYYPIQIPYVLDSEFAGSIRYSEWTDASLADFAICLWEMRPQAPVPRKASNVIVADGCIDLVVAFDSGEIVFSGMSDTVFDYRVESTDRYFGARLKPGSFHCLTGLPALDAMDAAVPYVVVDPTFDVESFFALPYEQAKAIFAELLRKLAKGKRPDAFVNLFDEMSGAASLACTDLYRRLNFSARQSQRLFHRHYGISPQKALSVLRFQHCLSVLVSGRAAPADLLTVARYCDQSHCIKDFKRHIGLTPLELMERYRVAEAFDGDTVVRDA